MVYVLISAIRTMSWLWTGNARGEAEEDVCFSECEKELNLIYKPLISLISAGG